jgi:ribosome-associated protein
MSSPLKYLIEDITKACRFETSRSGGKGGQNVNKVETKVAAIFDLANSFLFSDSQKALLINNLSHRISNGEIRVNCSATRSQLRNKEMSVERLIEMLEKGLKKDKRRIPTKISRRKKAARSKTKKINQQKKDLRKKPGLED